MQQMQGHEDSVESVASGNVDEIYMEMFRIAPNMQTETTSEHRHQ